MAETQIMDEGNLQTGLLALMCGSCASRASVYSTVLVPRECSASAKDRRNKNKAIIKFERERGCCAR
jgi:hypothetical protein